MKSVCPIFSTHFILVNRHSTVHNLKIKNGITQMFFFSIHEMFLFFITFCSMKLKLIYTNVGKSNPTFGILDLYKK